MAFATDVIDLIGFFSFFFGGLTLASAGYKMGEKKATHTPSRHCRRECRGSPLPVSIRVAREQA